MFCISYKNKPATYKIMHQAISDKVIGRMGKSKTSGDPEAWKEFIVRRNKKQTIISYLRIFGGEWSQRPKGISVMKLEPINTSDLNTNTKQGD